MLYRFVVFSLPLAHSVADVQTAIEYIFPLVYEFRKVKTPEDMPAAKKRRLLAAAAAAESTVYQQTLKDEAEEAEDSDTSECL